MEYNWEAYSNIRKQLLGVKADNYGTTSLGSYRSMMTEIQINHNNDPGMCKKLNTLVTPYIDDIKTSPNKVLMPAKQEDNKMTKVILSGLDTEVEFDETKVFSHTEEDGQVYEAAVTTDGKLIAWDDGANSWTQIKRWAE